MPSELQLKGKLAEPSTIDLYGLFGGFRIGGSPFQIKYVSTFANPTRSDGHASLLKELKPMRERTSAKDLHDLSSLLQRDLNDARVAQELVPYLQGSQRQIGFFPAILAVIVPRNYLVTSSGEAHYPHPAAAGSDSVDFEGCWSVQSFKLGTDQLPMGLLRIVTSKTDIIVLDGQHRANAFRFVSGVFQPQESIYQTFYDKVSAAAPLDADLPVTLIWFESTKDIDPRLISRQLFVDVNNNAKPVSPARTILLDDRTVSCVGTQEFYNLASERGFDANRFSLLHGAFDMDVELATGLFPSFALTTPEIVEEALRWAFFGTTTYDQLSQWNVQRMHLQRNTARFAQLWPTLPVPHSGGDEEGSGVIFKSPTDARDFRQRFRSDYQPVLTQLFDELGFLKPHYEASRVLAEQISTQGDTTTTEVWNKVFCGGEGLYWSFETAADNPRSKKYKSAIDEVERSFSEGRAKMLNTDRNDADVIYRSFTTKAFQVGYVMAVDYLVRNNGGTWIEAAMRLIGGLNQYSNAQWLAVFADLRPLVVGSAGATPKLWPAYRNVLLRMLDGIKGEIYSDANLVDSPDWRAYQTSLTRAASNLAGTSDSMPDDRQIKQHATAEFQSVQTVLRECGLSAQWFAPGAVLKRGIEFLTDELKKTYTNDCLFSKACG